MVEPETDNMIKVTSDGRKASLEIRLFAPSADNHSQSKVNQWAWNVWQICKASMGDRATQLIFCDFSTPYPERHNMYRYIRDLLVKLGISKTEVALIHDCKTDSVGINFVLRIERKPKQLELDHLQGCLF